MNNIIVWLILGCASIIFGIFDRISVSKDPVFKDKSVIFWFFEVWRSSVSYFITSVIGYFLVAIRWPDIVQSGSLSSGDFVLCLAFFIGVLGWWPYFIKNITEGINAIVAKLLDK